MKSFVVYELSTGAIRHRVVTKMYFAQDLPVGCWVKEANADPATDRAAVEVNPWNPPIVPLPASTPSTSDINATRDRLEQAPITVNGNRYDYDTVARERMGRAIAQWNHITHTKVGGKIAWKDADNQVGLFTLAELTALRDGLEIEFASRADRLHAHARYLISQLPNVTPAMLEESQWPMTA